MERAQATVEYLLLVVALTLGGCLLVRFWTPVEAVAMAVAHAFAPPPHHARTPGRPPRPHRPRKPPVRKPRRPCVCPLATRTSPAGVDGSLSQE
jgi:hypothetical protein